MLCAKERSVEEMTGSICRACSDAVRREATGAKRREKREADQALRSRGQEPTPPKPDRRK